MSSEPLVIAAVVESAADVGGARAALAADHHGVRFIGVIAVNDEAHLERILVGFQPHFAEVIFTATARRGDLAGTDAAWLALERHAMGQDFVFTVAALDDAVRYAVECLTTRQRDQWEGTAILVLGAADMIDAVRTCPCNGDTIPTRMPIVPRLASSTCPEPLGCGCFGDGH